MVAQADGPAVAVRDRSAGSGQPRVMVVTASMGAGHTRVADELARRLGRYGPAEVVDVLAVAGAAGRRLRWTYRTMLNRAPWSYAAAMHVWQRWPEVMERITAAGAGPFESGLASAAARFRPDVIVSTFNLASLCLGRMAGRGLIAAPVITLLTDPGPHPYWVSRRVGLHLVPTPIAATAFREYGAPRVAVVAPVLRREFSNPPDRTEARRRLGLPSGRRHVMVTGGSWGVGGIDGTVAALARAGDIDVTVACGRNRDLFRRWRGDPRVRVLGWTDDMCAHLAAMDVVVDNAGGLTCWEALACRTGVVLHRPLPGHGRANADALVRTGLARLASTGPELRRSVRMPPGPGTLPTGPDAADLVLAEAYRVRGELEPSCG